MTQMDLKTFSRGGVFLSENDNLLVFYPKQAGKYSFDYYQDGKWRTEDMDDLILKMVYFCHEYDLVCEL